MGTEPPAGTAMSDTGRAGSVLREGIDDRPGDRAGKLLATLWHSHLETSRMCLPARTRGPMCLVKVGDQ